MKESNHTRMDEFMDNSLIQVSILKILLSLLLPWYYSPCRALAFSIFSIEISRRVKVLQERVVDPTPNHRYNGEFWIQWVYSLCRSYFQGKVALGYLELCISYVCVCLRVSELCPCYRSTWGCNTQDAACNSHPLRKC